VASEQEVAYHRSFLSPYYLDNFSPPTWWQRIRREEEEVEAIRLRDPVEFENTRKSLAKVLRVPYYPGVMASPRGDQGGRARWVSGNPPDDKVAEIMEPTNPPQGVVKSPTTGMVAMPFPVFKEKAYLLGKGLHEVSMYYKMDQQFEDYATPWELLWSDLSYPYNRGFTPVVDSSWKVIGHVGMFPGGPRSRSFGETSLIVPSQLAGHITLEQAMANGVPVFVHSATGLPNGWDNANFYTTEHKIQVTTGLDGEVVDFQVWNTGFLEQPWYSPMDVIAAGRILIGLTRIGGKLVTSLLRKTTAKLEARATLQGATRSLAREAEEKAGKQTAAWGVREGDLVSLPRSRGASRVIKPAEMEALLRDELKKRPYLARLRLARRLDGPALKDELMSIVKEWKDSTGKLHFKVTEGTVKRLGSQGAGGWALDSLSGKEVLIIEEQMFEAPKKLLNEVTHELVYDAVRDGLKGVPALGNESPFLNFAHDWLERVIKEGEPTWNLLRGMGKK
jgi:hypothetical protein